MLGAEAYFDLEEFKHKKVFEGTEFVWEAVGNLKKYNDKRKKIQNRPGQIRGNYGRRNPDRMQLRM